ALLHEPGTALVREDSVRLLRRAADVRAVGDRPGAVAVLSDCRPGVRDVALVRVGRRLAGGVAGNTADEDSEQRERPEREAARQHDHASSLPGSLALGLSHGAMRCVAPRSALEGVPGWRPVLVRRASQSAAQCIVSTIQREDVAGGRTRWRLT